ncbi:MAG: hypothetical protein HY707_06450 [Ignavibacteriae bacterium]|nr:hypothetical protein [Ignavibacteriota bacterium]
MSYSIEQEFANGMNIESLQKYCLSFPLKALFLLTMIFSTVAHSQEEQYYFYHGRNYGSESIFNPLALIINGGFGILQYDNRTRNLFEIRYKNGFNNVIANLSHPVRSINEFGWKNFLGNEIYPGSLKKKNAQYWPNYQNHLIGGGMSYVAVKEWYRYHNYSHPTLLALGTIAVYHFLNEIVENNAFEGINVDPIADVYVFNPLSIVLFSIDGVQKFFSQTLNMADWSTQPTYNPSARTIENQGQNFSIKYKLPFSERLSYFYYWGLTGLSGLSYETESGEYFSLGAGLRAKELVSTEEQTNARKLTVTLTWNVGFFYDRDNSLLASVLFSGISNYKFHINVYPGIISFGRFSPGFFCALGEQGRFVSGFSVNFFPLGLATRLR